MATIIGKPELTIESIENDKPASINFLMKLDPFEIKKIIDVPSVIAPLNDTIRLSGEEKVILEWEEDSLSQQYIIETSLTPDFEIVLNRDTVETTNISYSLDFGETIFWRIMASSENSESAWSCPMSFTILQTCLLYTSPSPRD